MSPLPNPSTHVFKRPSLKWSSLKRTVTFTPYTHPPDAGKNDKVKEDRKTLNLANAVIKTITNDLATAGNLLSKAQEQVGKLQEQVGKLQEHLKLVSS